MNASHESQVSRGSWLKRLAITAAGLCFATFATAGSVTITGTTTNTCAAWSSVSGDANGNLTFVCGTTQNNGPGTVTLSAPTSISFQTVNAGATRSGGVNTPVDVTYTVSGAGCTSATGLVQWGATENGTKPIPVQGVAAGTCTIDLAVSLGSPAGIPTSKNVTVVSPDANVAFDFDVATVNGNTSFGNAATVIRVKRTGGSNGDWAVPLSYTGFLASTQTPAAGVLAASAGSTVALLQFPPGSTEASVSFTPASTVPAGFPALPLAGGVTIGTPLPLTVPLGQGFTIPAVPTRAYSLVAVTGCPVLSNVLMKTLGPPNKGVSYSIQKGQIASFPMPSPLATGGYVQMVQDPGSPTSMDVEIWYSTCPGDATDPLRAQVGAGTWGGTGKPCVKYGGYQGGPVYWNKNTGSSTVCKIPDVTGPYYVNYRHNTCPNLTCPMIIQYNNTTP